MADHLELEGGTDDLLLEIGDFLLLESSGPDGFLLVKNSLFWIIAAGGGVLVSMIALVVEFSLGEALE